MKNPEIISLLNQQLNQGVNTFLRDLLQAAYEDVHGFAMERWLG